MKKQILIIEDQVSTRKLLSHYLGNQFQVIEMENALDAIRWLSEGNFPNAIISDIIMPDSSGLEFLTQIKDTDQKNIPVLMLSGVENSTEKLKCFKLGAKDYMVKPFNPEELMLRLNNLVN